MARWMSPTTPSYKLKLTYHCYWYHAEPNDSPPLSTSYYGKSRIPTQKRLVGDQWIDSNHNAAFHNVSTYFNGQSV